MGLELRERIAGSLKNLVKQPIATGTKNATTLVIASNKGGVGKTTTAINLAVAMTQQSLDVLLIDLDPQAHVKASLPVRMPAMQTTLSHVLMGRGREVKECCYPSGYSKLDLAGSEKNLSETEMVMATKIGKELLLDQALEITRSHYDLIIIDCPPNLGVLTLNALCCADQLLIPVDMSVLALEGVNDMVETVGLLKARLARKIQILGILHTRVDTRTTRMNQLIAQGLIDLHPSKNLKSFIPQNSALNKAHFARQSIFEFDKNSKGAEAYRALAKELGPPLGLRFKKLKLIHKVQHPPQL